MLEKKARGLKKLLNACLLRVQSCPKRQSNDPVIYLGILVIHAIEEIKHNLKHGRAESVFVARFATVNTPLL